MFDDLEAQLQEIETDFDLDPQDFDWLFNGGPLIAVDCNRLGRLLAVIDSTKMAEFEQFILERLFDYSLVEKAFNHLRNMSFVRRRCLKLGLDADLCKQLSRHLGFPLFYCVEAKAGSRYPPADPRWFVGATTSIVSLLDGDPHCIEIFVLNSDWDAVHDLLAYYRRRTDTLAGQNLQLIFFNDITIHVTDERDPFCVTNLGPSVMHCYWQGEFHVTYDCMESIVRKRLDHSVNDCAKELWLGLGFQVESSFHKAVWLEKESLEQCAAKQHFNCKRAVPLSQFKPLPYKGNQHWTEYAKWDHLEHLSLRKRQIYQSPPMDVTICKGFLYPTKSIEFVYEHRIANLAMISRIKADAWNDGFFRACVHFFRSDDGCTSVFIKLL